VREAFAAAIGVARTGTTPLPRPGEDEHDLPGK
jgi:hypothetical protein